MVDTLLQERNCIGRMKHLLHTHKFDFQTLGGGLANYNKQLMYFRRSRNHRPRFLQKIKLQIAHTYQSNLNAIKNRFRVIR